MTRVKLASPFIKDVAMARAFADIEKDVLTLNDEDKLGILRSLLQELDGPADPGVEQAWLEEVQRRSRELDQGTVSAIPADEVFAQVRADLKR